MAAARAEYAWLHGDDRRAAEEAAGMFRPWAATSGSPRNLLAAARRRAGAAPAVMAEPHRLLLAGDWRAAADAWRERGYPYQQALALARGDQDEALLEALALLDALGARQTALRLRRQLRQRGNLRVPAARPGRPPASPAGRSRCSACWPRA